MASSYTLSTHRVQNEAPEGAMGPAEGAMHPPGYRPAVCKMLDEAHILYKMAKVRNMLLVFKKENNPAGSGCWLPLLAALRQIHIIN